MQLLLSTAFHSFSEHTDKRMLHLLFAGGVDFRFAESIMSTQVSITGRTLSSGETLSIGPVELFKEGRYELDEVIQLELFPAEGETALQTGDPATIVLQDSDGECVFELKLRS